MGDKARGLYPEGKFVVLRKDGTDAPGRKHDGCQYFVLDVTHDPHAVPALQSYAVSARKDGYGLLADDLEKTVGRNDVARALYDAISALLSVMEMQEGRETEDLHIIQREARYVWDKAKAQARAALNLVNGGAVESAERPISARGTDGQAS